MNRQVLRWSRRALLASAIVLLGYCGYAFADAWIFQRRAGAAFDRQPAGRPEATVFVGGSIGRLEIPRLALSVAVAEGVGRASLQHAVGHIPGTALPGDAGNVGLAGHRDTFFRPLKDLRIKDQIQIATLRGTFRYQVVSLTIVGPGDVEVLAPVGEDVLTLVTCYPFYFVGPAPKRWIVRARQVAFDTAPAGSVK